MGLELRTNSLHLCTPSPPAVSYILVCGCHENRVSDCLIVAQPWVIAPLWRRKLVAFGICSGHQLSILEPSRHCYGPKHKIQFTNFILALQHTCMICWMLHSSAILLGNQLASFLACNWVSSISTAWSKGRGRARNSLWQRVQDVKRYQPFMDWIDQREKIW